MHCRWAGIILDWGARGEAATRQPGHRMSPLCLSQSRRRLALLCKKRQNLTARLRGFGRITAYSVILAPRCSVSISVRLRLCPFRGPPSLPVWDATNGYAQCTGRMLHVLH